MVDGVSNKVFAEYLNLIRGHLTPGRKSAAHLLTTIQEPTVYSGLSIPHLKTLILTSVNVLLILSLLGAHKCRILRPRRKGHPRVIQNLQEDIHFNSNFCLSKVFMLRLSSAMLSNSQQAPTSQNTKCKKINKIKPY